MSRGRPRLVLATTVWKRPALTDAVLRHYRSIRRQLADEIELVLLAVGSEGNRSREICERNGFAYLEHENHPVTDKWNAVIARAREHSPRGVIIVNSDDVVDASLFPAYLERLDRGADYLGLRGTHVVDLVTLQHGIWPGYEASFKKYRVGEPAGCARGFSARLLDATGWRLWPPTPKRSSSMDFWCTRFLELFGFEPEAPTMAQLGVTAVQIKTDVNITTLNLLPLVDVGAGESAFALLRSVAGPDLEPTFREIHEELAAGAREHTPYRYASEGCPPVYRIEDIPVTGKHGDVMKAIREMRAAVLGP